MLLFNLTRHLENFRTMKNKRKHIEQADKAEELAKRKLAKLSKVVNHVVHNLLAFCLKKF